MKRCRLLTLASAAGLSLLVLGSLLLRVWGVGWDYLYPRHHDELIHLHTATTFSRGELSPRVIWEKSRYPKYVLYPWFSMYVVAGGYRAWELLDGGMKSLASHPAELDGLEMLRPGELTPQKALLLGRILIALMGTGTVMAVYGIGHRLAGRGPGFLAAAFLAVTGYHVANCHWLKNDVSTLFFLVLGTYCASRYLAGGGFANLAWGMLFVALGVNSKYHVFPGFFVVLSALALRGSPGVKAAFRRLLSWRVVFLLAIFIAGLVASFPLIYLDFEYFRGNILDYLFRMPNEYLLSGGQQHSSLSVKYMNLVNLARFSAEPEHGMGLVGTVLGFLALVWAVLRRNRVLIFLAVFPVVYIPLAVFGASPGLRLQDTVPLYPFLELLGAIMVWRLSHCLFRRPLPAVLAFSLAGLLLVFPEFRASLRMAYGYWQPDTCVYATEWAGDNLAPGSLVGREYKSISLEEGRYHDVVRRRLCVVPLSRYANQGFRYLVVTARQRNRVTDPYGEFGPDHPFARFYEELPTRYDLIKEFSLGEVPYKGGDIQVWELRANFPLAPRGLNSGLLRHFTADYCLSAPRLLFPGPTGACEGRTGFMVGPESRDERLLISSWPLQVLGVEATVGREPGTVRARAAGDKQTRDLSSGGTGVFVFSPRTGFPGINYSYRAGLSSPWNSPCLARIITDSFRMGLAFLRAGEPDQALPWLARASRESPADWYPPSLAAQAARDAGREERECFWAAEAARRFPGRAEQLFRLRDASLSRDEWAAIFSELSGFSPDWLEARAGPPPLAFAEDGEWRASVPVDLAPGRYRVVCRWAPGAALELKAPAAVKSEWAASLPEVRDGKMERVLDIPTPAPALVFLIRSDSPRSEIEVCLRPDLRDWLKTVLRIAP